MMHCASMCVCCYNHRPTHGNGYASECAHHADLPRSSSSVVAVLVVVVVVVVVVLVVVVVVVVWLSNAIWCL